MSTLADQLNRLEHDLSDAAEVAYGIAIDAGADDPQDVLARASTLESALRALSQDVKEIRSQIDTG